MTGEQQRELRELEGRTVHIALADGSVLDRASLVLARRGSLWVYANGADAFLPIDSVVDVWEARPLRYAA